MTVKELRRRLKDRVDSLDDEYVKVADHFISFLEDRANEEATRELLNIPGLLEELKESEKDITAGKLTDWRKVRNDV